MNKHEISIIIPQPRVLISLLRHQCDHVTTVNVFEKLLIMLGYNYTVRFIAPILYIDVTLLCEFESDKT